MNHPPPMTIFAMPGILIASSYRRLTGLIGTTGRKGVVALMDQAVVSGSSFLTTVLIGRFCGAEELGIYSLAFTLLLVIACVAESLNWTPFAVFLHRRPIDRKFRYAGSALAIQLMWTGLVFGSLMAVGTMLQLVLGPGTLTSVVWVLMIIVPFHMLREFVRRMLLAELHVWQVLLIDALVVALQFTGFAILISQNALSAWSAGAVIGAACAMVACVYLIVFAHRFQFRRKFLRVTMLRHWRFGRWLCASQLADVSQQFCLNWLLLVLMGTAATGVYAACAMIASALNPVITGIGNVLLARASQLYALGGGSEVRRVVWKATVVMLASMSLFLLAVVVLAQHALDVLYGGPEFAGLGSVVVVLALATWISAVSFPAETGLRVIGRPDINFKAGVLGLGLTLVSAGPLIFYHGVLGGTVAALIGTLFVSVVLMIAFHQLTKPVPRLIAPAA